MLCGAEGPPRNCRSYALAFLDEMERPYSPYKKRFEYHTLVMFYKIHSRNAPHYLTSLLPPLSLSSGYAFRKLSYMFQAVKRTSTIQFPSTCSSFLERTSHGHSAIQLHLHFQETPSNTSKSLSMHFTNFQLSLSLSLSLSRCLLSRCLFSVLKQITFLSFFFFF